MKALFSGKKKKFFLGILICCLLSFSFWELFSPLIFEKSISFALKTFLKGETTQFSLEKKEGVWVANSPEIQLFSRQVQFQAKQISWECIPQFSKGILEIRLNLDEPHLKGALSLDEIKKFFNEKQPFLIPFQIHWKVSFKDAVFDFLEEEPLILSGDWDFKKKEGKCLLKASQGALLYHSYGGKQTLECRNFETKSVFSLAKSLVPSWRVIQAFSGVLKGSVSLDEKGIFGDLDFVDCQFKTNLKGMEGQFPLIQAHFEPSLESLCKIELALGSKLKEENLWEMKQLQGTLLWASEELVKFSLKGEGAYLGKEKKLQIEGDFLRSVEGEGALSFDFNLMAPQEKPISVQFLARQLGKKWQFIQMGLRGLDKAEFSLLEEVVFAHIPLAKEIKIQAEHFDADLSLYLKEGQIAEAKLENMEARDFVFSSPLWKAQGQCPKFSGSLALSFIKGDPFSTLQAHLHTKEAKIEWQGEEGKVASLEKGSFDVVILNGQFKQVNIQGSFFGLETQARLLEKGNKKGLSIQLEGSLNALFPFLPKEVQDPSRQVFTDNLVTVDLTWIPKRKKHAIQGCCHIDDKQGETISLDFGWTLERDLTFLNEELPFYFLAQSASQFIVPPMSWPLALFEQAKFQENRGLFGFKIENGWFKAENVSLSKYLAPFIFYKPGWDLKGKADFFGNFDHTMLVLTYQGEDLELFSQDLIVDVKQLKEGKHYIDWTEGTHFGLVNVERGSYFEKNTGLLFTEVKSKILFEGTKAHLDEVETFCNGLFFSGAVDVDWSDPRDEVFTVFISTDVAEGKVSDLHQFLLHFKNPLLHLKPFFEGRFSLKEEGADIRLFFSPNGIEMDASLKAILRDGFASFEVGPSYLQDFGMSIEWNHQKKLLSFTDLQGTMFVGDVDLAEEYALGGEGICFSNLSEGIGTFDVWLGEGKLQQWRIKGNMECQDNQPLVFHIDKTASHLLTIFPSQAVVEMKEGDFLDRLELKCEFPLSKIVHPIQTLIRQGGLSWPSQIKEKVLSWEETLGNVALAIDYEGVTSKWSFSLEGNDLSFGKESLSHLRLQGSKRGAALSVQELALDQLCLSSDLLKTEEGWRINFLGVSLAESLLMGLDGMYVEKTGQIKGSINRLEVDFDALPAWSIFSAIEPYAIKGKGKGVGFFALGLDGNWNMDLQASLNSFSCKEISFEEIKNVQVSFFPDRMSVQGLKSRVVSGPFGNAEGQFQLKEGCFDFQRETLSLQSLAFSVPSQHLPLFWKNLSVFFKEPLLSEEIEAQVFSLKQEEIFSGCLDFKEERAQLSLSPGKYWLEGTAYELQGVNFFFEEGGIQAKGVLVIEGNPLNFHFSSDSKEWKFGQCVLETNEPIQNPLTIFWKLDEKEAFIVERATGHFSGLQIEAIRDEKSSLLKNKWKGRLHLKGNPDAVKKYFSNEIKEKFNLLKLGLGWELTGDLELDKEGEGKFEGMLVGRHCHLLGYLWDQVSVAISWTPYQTQLSGFQVYDQALALNVPLMQFQWDPHLKHFYFNVPNIHLSDFRPCLLQEVGSSDPIVMKPLIVKSLDLNTFSGILTEPNSFQGVGKLVFSNSERKNPIHPLLAIPQEIINRIGLDFSALNPVGGTIQFFIADGRIYLNKLKDVYSEGKLSRFYLGGMPGESYIDFSGKISLQIRMKQYNLLFKLAELFTVNVGGTWDKPNYSLQKVSDR